VTAAAKTCLCGSHGLLKQKQKSIDNSKVIIEGGRQDRQLWTITWTWLRKDKVDGRLDASKPAWSGDLFMR